jgi:hypothetical protein
MHYHPGQELSNIETKVLLKTHLLFSIRMHASSRHSVARHSIACTLVPENSSLASAWRSASIAWIDQTPSADSCRIFLEIMPTI